MVKIYYDKDADVKILKKKKIAIIGYGSQGHAHTNNLKESGMDVLVGEIKGINWEKAKNAGFTVITASEAAKKADVIMMLVPDEYMAEIYRNEISPHIRRGTYLGFAHGFNIGFPTT